MKDLLVWYSNSQSDDIPLYVYEALLSVFCIAVVFILTNYGVKNGWRKVVMTLLYEYSFLLYCPTIIFREAQQHRGIELTPFWSYGAIREGSYVILPETIMNVIVFIPVGLMMGLAYREANWKRVLVVGASLSFSIELLQLLFKKGCFEIDDILHNTLGCIIGYGIFKLVRYVVNKIRVGKCTAQR